MEQEVKQKEQYEQRLVSVREELPATWPHAACLTEIQRRLVKLNAVLTAGETNAVIGASENEHAVVWQEQLQSALAKMREMHPTFTLAAARPTVPLHVDAPLLSQAAAPPSVTKPPAPQPLQTSTPHDGQDVLLN